MKQMHQLVLDEAEQKAKARFGRQKRPLPIPSREAIEVSPIDFAPESGKQNDDAHSSGATPKNPAASQQKLLADIQSAQQSNHRVVRDRLDKQSQRPRKARGTLTSSTSARLLGRQPIPQRPLHMDLSGVINIVTQGQGRALQISSYGESRQIPTIKRE